MNTVRGFHLCDHSRLGEGVIACDTQLLRFKNTQAAAELSVAIHAASGDGLGWDLEFRSVTSPALLRAFHTSRINERHFGKRGPSYIVDAGQDIRSIDLLLERHGVDAQFSNSMYCLQKVHVERFFRDITAPSLASLRKQFKRWSQFYHNRTSLHQSAAKTFNRQVGPLSLRNRNRDWPKVPISKIVSVHWQNDPQRGRSSKLDHHIQ